MIYFKLKVWLFRQLFTENEKCLLNQAVNLQKQEICKDAVKGLNCDYKEDINDLTRLSKMFENGLWN